MKKRPKRFSKHTIEEIVRLRRDEDYSYTLLAKIFKRDHTTIMYHCLKAGLDRNHRGSITIATFFPKNEKIQRQYQIEESKKQEIIEKHNLKPREVYKKPQPSKYSWYEEALVKQISKKVFNSESEKQQAINTAISEYRRNKY